jgi:hypothetical protein
MEVLFSSTRSHAFWLKDIYLLKICTSDVSKNKINCWKKYITMGGWDVQLIFCDMHLFHFSKVYFCTTYIFKNVEKQNLYFWIHIYISTKKRRVCPSKEKSRATFVVEKLNWHIFHFFKVLDPRWKKIIHICGPRKRKWCTYQNVIRIYFWKTNWIVDNMCTSK